MMHSHNFNTYQQNQIITASPEQILLMLYDGAIRFTRWAITGVEQNDKAMVSSGVGKALAIISEFSNSLNHEIGKNIAEDLDALYGFMIRELTLANLHQDLEKLEVVEKLLIDLRATWSEAVEISRSERIGEGVTPSNSATKVEVERDSSTASHSHRSQTIPSIPENYVSFSISR